MEIVVKNLLCKIGLHKWNTIKSMKVSHIILLLKRHSQVLKNVNVKIENDYIVKDRICLKCGETDYEIQSTKEYYKTKMLLLIKAKNE
jgi:hypothetical protein